MYNYDEQERISSVFIEAQIRVSVKQGSNRGLLIDSIAAYSLELNVALSFKYLFFQTYILLQKFPIPYIIFTIANLVTMRAFTDQ